jgi:TP901 family phage tail tape measure protein
VGQHRVEAVFETIDQMSSVMSTIANNVAAGAGAIGQVMSGVGGDFSEAGAALMAFATGPVGALEYLVGSLGQFAAEVDAAMDGMEARTGAGEAEMGRLRDATDAVFKTGIADNFTEAANAVEAVRNRVQALAQDSDLSEFTRKVLGVASAWNVSSDSVAKAIGVAQKMFDDFARDPNLTLDVLVKAAQESSKPLKEIDAIVTGYGPKFAAAGLSGMAFGGLIVAASKAGIGQQGMGGLATALDTFHNKLANPPRAFTNAMRQLGLSDVLKDLRANKIPMDQALNEIFLAFEKMPDGPQKTQAALALFGTAINKIGGPETLGQLAGFRDALGGPSGVQGAAQKVADIIQDDGTLGTAIKQFGNNFKVSFEQGANGAYNIIKNTDWAGVFDGIKKSAVDRISQMWDDIKNKASNAITTVWNWISKADWQGAINNVMTQARDFVVEKWNAIVDFVNGIIGNVKKAFEGIAKAIMDALGPVLDIINKILQAIKDIGNAHLPGGGGGGGGVGFQAEGGDMQEGWNVVGEEGPELAFKRGGTTTVFSNRDSRTMLGSGAGASGGVIYNVNVSGNTILGSSAGEFGRMIKRALQEEDQRRGRLAP